MFESMKTKKSKNNNITHTSYYGQWNFCHGIPFLCVCLHQLSFSLQNIMILNLERAPFKIHRHCLHAKMRQKLFPPYCWTNDNVLKSRWYSPMNPTHNTKKKIHFFFLSPNITQTSQLNPLHTLLKLRCKYLVFVWLCSMGQILYK